MILIFTFVKFSIAPSCLLDSVLKKPSVAISIETKKFIPNQKSEYHTKFLLFKTVSTKS